MRISDWSSDVCSSDLIDPRHFDKRRFEFAPDLTDFLHTAARRQFGPKFLNLIVERHRHLLMIEKMTSPPGVECVGSRIAKRPRQRRWGPRFFPALRHAGGLRTAVRSPEKMVGPRRP